MLTQNDVDQPVGLSAQPAGRDRAALVCIINYQIVQRRALSWRAEEAEEDSGQ